jgi:hypothetical protein
MRRLFPILAALALPCLGSAQAAGDPASGGSGGRRLLDEVVAIINKQPLLFSELQLEARVTLIAQGALAAAREELSPSELESALEYAIGQRLAFAEADRLQVFQVDDEEVLKALRELASRFPTPADLQRFLARHEASEEQLGVILRRQIRVARYLDSRVKLAARVSEEELKRFFAEHQDDFSGQGFQQVRESIKSALTRDRYRQLAKKLMDELRSRAEVRVVARFEPAPASPTPPSPDGGQPRP